MTTASDTASASPFTRVPARRRGYDPAAVDEFLETARRTFQGAARDVTSDHVRAASFPLIRGGYEIAAVDKALARLEDAFAQQERDAAIEARGSDAWVAEARLEAQELLLRLTRPESRRFDRVSWLRTGYSVREVDAVADRLARYFADGSPVTVDQVRQAAFHPQRGGYREEQVDAVLDAVVRVMLAVR